MSEDAHDITDGPTDIDWTKHEPFRSASKGPLDERLRHLLVEIMALRLTIDSTMQGMERAIAEIRHMTEEL